MMKKYLIIILSAIALGGGLAYFIFYKVMLKDSTSSTLTVSAFQVGVFSNYDNALKVADRNNGIVIPDDDLYRVYVAILYDNDAIDKLSNYYKTIGLNYYLKEISVTQDFINNIKDDEELIKKSSSETYSTINLDVLNKYKELT